MLISIMRLFTLNTGTFGASRILKMACATLRRWQQERAAAAELHTMSDYSLRDIGVARSQIDARVRLPEALRAANQLNRLIRNHLTGILK